MYPTIAFIGVGNMAQAMICGMLASGYPASRILGFRRNLDAIANLGEQGVQLCTTLQQAVSNADLLVLAVKPWQIVTIAQSCQPFVPEKMVVTSVAAGITTDQLATALPGRQIVRLMPNTPVAVNQGVIGCYAQQGQNAVVEAAFASLGTLVWLDDEEQMHALTAVSGCGPAFYFQILEHMQQIASNLGLPITTSKKLVLQTLIGAGALAQQNSDSSFAQLIGQIISKGSATGMGLQAMEQKGLSACLREGVQGSHRRAKELARFQPDD